ncbi:MAG: hypothetical protein GX235_01825 [Clostridiales bacterium]|nr:hypothetical protein [Clostridiales bacterium]
MNKKLIYIFLFTLFTFWFSGCGDDKELEEYKNNMDTFYSDISEYDNIINSIDANAETSVQELLSALDGIEGRFAWMASLTVPEEFSSIETLSAEASEYMTNAVSLYHQAFESETFDSDSAESAKAYYDRANQNVQYILSILHGDVPDGDDIPYSESSE